MASRWGALAVSALAAWACLAGEATAQDAGRYRGPSWAEVREDLAGLGALFLTRIHDGRQPIYLTKPLFYCENVSGRMYQVPAGFVSDLTSIPETYRGYFRDSTLRSSAAVLHDWMYAIGEPGGKAEADRLLYYAMAEEGVPDRELYPIYAAVSVFGEKGYRDDLDWMFVDLATGRLVDPRPPKPTRVAYEQTTNCQGFEGFIRAHLAPGAVAPTVVPRRQKIRFLYFFVL